MGKQIDWNAPVAEADKAWAAQFPQLHGELLELQQAQFPAETPETLEGQEEDDAEAPYTEWTIAELQTEVRRRNADEAKGLPVPSKKSDLVRVLETDDESEALPA